jgi:hypothetical protein
MIIKKLIDAIMAPIIESQFLEDWGSFIGLFYLDEVKVENISILLPSLRKISIKQFDC